MVKLLSLNGFMGFVLFFVGSLLLGCSNSEPSPEPHQKCTTLLWLKDHSTRRVPVTCSPPVDIMLIHGQSRYQVEQVLGPPYQGLDLEDAKPTDPGIDRVYYKDGGIVVFYEDGVATDITLFPENIPLTLEAVLEFLGQGGIQPKAAISPGMIIWDATSEYPGVAAGSDRDAPGVVYEIYIK